MAERDKPPRTSVQIVECTGLPGSGKTTLCADIARKSTVPKSRISTKSLQLGDMSFVARNLSKVLLIASAMWKYPRSTMGLARWVMRQPIRFGAKKLSLVFNAMSVVGLYLPGRDLVVIDQGFFQIFWAVAYTAERDGNPVRVPEKFASLVGSIIAGKSLKLIFVETHRDQHAAMLSQRENWSDKRIEDWKASLNGQQAAFQRVKDLAHDFGDLIETTSMTPQPKQPDAP